jgi:hypothetical protein
MSRKQKKYKGPLWVQLYHWEMDLPAYRYLSVYGRALLLEFRRFYNGGNNGEIVMSVRQAAELLNCNKDTASKYLEELEEKGWIRLTEKGCFTQKTDKTASTWRITNQPISLGVDIPDTKEYTKWRPQKIQNTVLKNGTAYPCTSDREEKSGPNTSDRTPPICPTTSDRETSKTPSNGPTKPDTYISTIGVPAEKEREKEPESDVVDLLEIPSFLARRYKANGA